MITIEPSRFENIVSIQAETPAQLGRQDDKRRDEAEYSKRATDLGNATQSICEGHPFNLPAGIMTSSSSCNRQKLAVSVTGNRFPAGLSRVGASIMLGRASR